MGNVNEAQRKQNVANSFDRAEEGQGLVNNYDDNSNDNSWFSSAERSLRNSLGAEAKPVPKPDPPKKNSGTFASSIVSGTSGLVHKVSGALGGAPSTVTSNSSNINNSRNAKSIKDSSWSKMPFGNASTSISNSISNVTGTATENPCPCLPEMTYKQRMMGFLLFFVLGTAASMISTMYVPLIVIRPSKFAIPYTVGNLMSIGSTGFLVGPWRQIKTMFDTTRIVGSLVFFTSMIGTLYFAFVMKSGVGVLTCVIIQFAAYIWYVASYIPFGRAMVKKFACGCYQCIYKCCMRG